MPFATIDGIATHYELVGSGEPLLMFSPGGFDATLQKWSKIGVYAATGMLAKLAGRYQCIVFDRRETGESGGRVEPVGWAQYAAQGKGLLDHLGIERAHLMGGCMGCGPVVALAAAHPHRVKSMVLYWPVGGARYRINGQLRFAQHLAFVHQEGLAAVVRLAVESGKSFGEDPRVGPWSAVLRRDAQFAAAYAAQDLERYRMVLTRMVGALMDRDTAPGAEPEDMLRMNIPALIVPGQDASHATSAARYLHECLGGSDYWDIPPAGQTAANVPARLLQFLDTAGAPG